MRFSQVLNDLIQNKDKKIIKLDQEYEAYINSKFLKKFKQFCKQKFSSDFEIEFDKSKGVIISGTNCYIIF